MLPRISRGQLESPRLKETYQEGEPLDIAAGMEPLASWGRDELGLQAGKGKATWTWGRFEKVVL